MKTTKLLFFTIIFLSFSKILWAQDYKVENDYIRKLRILGIPFNDINFITKKSKFISFFDSTYLVDVIINRTAPGGYTKVKGKYIIKKNRIVLFNKEKRYKVLKIKSKYLVNNVFFGFIREEYYPTKNE